MTATSDPARTSTCPAPVADPPLRSASGLTRLTSPELIGRATELDQLRRISDRPPALVVIEGEAGVGKSRLIRDWLAEPQLAALPALVGHCTALTEPFPFGPVIDALAGAARWLAPPSTLSPVTGALRPLLPELSERLPPPLEPLGNRRQERHRVFRAIRDLLGSIGPAVMVLEDLHEVDSGTRELLRFLLDRLPEQLTLVLTYRREDLTDPSEPVVGAIGGEVSQLRLALRPLSAAQVAELATAIDPAVTGELAVRIHERTMGIPLAVEEMLGALRDRPPPDAGAPSPDAPALPDDAQIPSALRDALLERVSRLSASARRLLHAAAILETPATEELLGRVAGVPAAHATSALAELVARALLCPEQDGRYGFRHSLARQAVHDSLAEPVRRQLHRRAVKALRDSDTPPLGQLARHCRAAGLMADWHRYAEAAADHAITLGDDRTASRLLHDVVTRPEADRATRIRIAIKLGRAALTGLSHSEALVILRHTLAEPGLPAEVRGELRLCLGVLLRNQASSARQGRAELERAIEELRGSGAPAARAMASLGAPQLLDGGHVDQHLAWLERAAHAAQRASDPQLEVLVRTNRAGALVAIGDPDGWPLAGPLPDPANVLTGPDDLPQRGRLAANLAWSATCVGRYQEAGSLIRTGERLTAGAADTYLACCLTGTALLYDHAVGSWEGLAARARAVTRTMSDVPSVVSEARLVLGLLALSSGELRDAREQLTDADASVPVAVAAAAGLARLASAAGDVDGATRWVRRGLDLVEGKGVWCWAAELLPTALSLLGRTAGQQPLARKLLDGFADGVSGRDAPLADAALVAAEAMLAETEGDHLAAASRHADAAAAYRALPRPYLAAQETEARGRCQLAAGRDGTQPLLEAMAAFERLGASWDVARCRHMLRSLGRELPHRRGRRGYGTQLSPRERDVVRLIRTGLTNREIAETLFLSPRTVEAHVARSLRKLGLSSRRALTYSTGATVAEQDGGPPAAGAGRR